MCTTRVRTVGVADKNVAACLQCVCFRDKNPSGQHECWAIASLTSPSSRKEKKKKGRGRGKEREVAMWLTLAH